MTARFGRSNTWGYATPASRQLPCNESSTLAYSRIGMTVDEIPYVTQLQGGPSTDGSAICVILRLADDTIAKFSVGLTDLPSVIVYLLAQAKVASETCKIETLESTLKPFETLAVEVSRIALGPANNKESAVLELDIGHIALRFALPIASLRALSDRVIHMTTFPSS